MALGAPEPKMPDGLLKNCYRWYKKDDYAGLYASRHSPHSFVQAVLFPGKNFIKLQACKVEDGNIHEVIDEEKAKKVANHLAPYLEENHDYYCAENIVTLRICQ